MIIDFKKISETNIDFYKKTFEFTEGHHLCQPTGEHYKLLTYISYLFNGITILDVGTNGAESAVALAQNPKNKVITYDIEKKWHDISLNGTAKPIANFLEQYKNSEFKLLDINEEDENIIKSAKVIFLDIAHDGWQEKKFSDTLERIGYEGYVFCDDIFAPWLPQMKTWWDSIDVEKYDLTEIGHTWGTGLINYFKDESIKIIR